MVLHICQRLIITKIFRVIFNPYCISSQRQFIIRRIVFLHSSILWASIFFPWMWSQVWIMVSPPSFKFIQVAWTHKFIVINTSQRSICSSIHWLDLTMVVVNRNSYYNPKTWMSINHLLVSKMLQYVIHFWKWCNRWLFANYMNVFSCVCMHEIFVAFLYTYFKWMKLIGN